MTIIIFLVDTSGSINQRTFTGTTLLDMTKGAIEHFMKVRSRDPASKWDRYMLLTFEDPPANIKAGWKESHATLISSLKNLKGSGKTLVGPALKNAFDLLNVNRMHSLIDSYGQGRFPYYLEAATIICFTDASSYPPGYDVVLPGSPSDEVKLTEEPFRWDQKLFGVLLKVPAVPPTESSVIFEPTFMNPICEVTGGRTYVVTNKRGLHNSMESIVQKVHAGVVLHFAKLLHEPRPPPPMDGKVIHYPEGWDNCKTTAFVQRSAHRVTFQGHWPIPEAFWPDLQAKSLPPRRSHPVLRVSCLPIEPVRMESFPGLPVDKYDLDACPLGRVMIDRELPNVCWQVSVDHSSKYSEQGSPFGYLRLSSNLLTVQLFILPFNYPILLNLLEEYRELKLKPTPRWKVAFDAYMKALPLYYIAPLKRMFVKMKIPHHELLPMSDSCLGHTVSNLLKQLNTKARVDYERIIASVGTQHPRTDSIQVVSRTSESLLSRPDFNDLMAITGGNAASLSHLKAEISKYESFSIRPPVKKVKLLDPKNPFDIPKGDLFTHLTWLRKAVHQGCMVSPSGILFSDEQHTVPMHQMSNYHEHAQRAPTPLREIDTQPERLNTFGNPFKVNKNLMIDEADEIPMARSGSPSPQRNGRRPATPDTPPSSPSSLGSPHLQLRKRGPLPRNFPLKRYRSPSPSPSADLANGIISPNASPVHPNDAGNAANPASAELDARLNGLSNDVMANGGGASPVWGNQGERPLVNGIGSQEGRGVGYPRPERGGSGPLAYAGDGRVGAMANDSRDNSTFNVNEGTEVAAYNAMLLKNLFREAKRPGRNFDQLFRQLNTVQGNLETRLSLVRELVEYAARWKRGHLIKLLGQFKTSMIDREATLTQENHEGFASRRA